jgi:hypothetical protein
MAMRALTIGLVVVSPLEKAVFECAAQLKGMSVSALLGTSAGREAVRILVAAGTVYFQTTGR